MKMHSRHTVKRTFSAIILLMVMMLQVGVKTFHLHHGSETEHLTCSDCEHHRVHNGHIFAWDGSSSDCVVCQLFSAPYCKAQEIRLNVVAAEHLTNCICNVGIIATKMQMHIIPRAPPAFLL